MRDIKYIVIHCTATQPNTKKESILNYWKNTLKIILLLASIIYTSYKTYDLHKKHKNNGSDNTSED